MFPSYALGEKDLHISPLRNYHNYIGIMDYLTIYVHVDTKAKRRHQKKFTCKETLRQVFIRFHWLEKKSGDTVSHGGIFDPALWTIAPLPSLWLNSHPPPPPFRVWISICTVYTYTGYRGGGWGSGTPRDKRLPQSPFTGKFFLRWRHFALTFRSLIFPRSTVILALNLIFKIFNWKSVPVSHQNGQVYNYTQNHIL